RGRRIREVLKQPPHATLSAPDQVVILLALTAGVFDDVSLDRIAEAEAIVTEAIRLELPEIRHAIAHGSRLGDAEREALIRVMLGRVAPLSGTSSDGGD